MKHIYLILTTIAIITSGCSTAQTQGPGQSSRPLFDGKTFEGWEGKLEIFRINDGAIIAGSLKQETPRNEFLCTTKEYGDFELRLKVKVVPATINAGIQFRSSRIPNHHEMCGYQADVGDKGIYWGSLYDESRRRKMLAEADRKELAKVLKPDDWNDYVIKCVGPKIELWINGLKTVDYTETDKTIPLTGLIGLQIHSGPAGEAWYRDITITDLSTKEVGNGK